MTGLLQKPSNFLSFSSNRATRTTGPKSANNSQVFFFLYHSPLKIVSRDALPKNPGAAPLEIRQHLLEWLRHQRPSKPFLPSNHLRRLSKPNPNSMCSLTKIALLESNLINHRTYGYFKIAYTIFTEKGID